MRYFVLFAKGGVNQVVAGYNFHISLVLANSADSNEMLNIAAFQLVKVLI